MWVEHLVTTLVLWFRGAMKQRDILCEMLRVPQYESVAVPRAWRVCHSERLAESSRTLRLVLATQRGSQSRVCQQSAPRSWRAN